jgi:methylenetetrahydrofolate reductase (NADPH)
LILYARGSIIKTYTTKEELSVKISELLKKNTLSLSFEVFPPKTETVFESVKCATEEIAKLRPSFMSVTYGAGGGTSKYTLEIAKNIKELYGVPTLAHLTCVSSTRETVRKKIREIKECGITNVMALRGDIPAEMENGDRSLWDYAHAVDLIRELKEENPDFCIGGACYPEVHPESENQRDDIKRLKEKVDAGCDFLTTQMFFDNNLLYNFLYKIREAGITVPVIPGIMPITNANQIERAIKLSGSFMPRRFVSLVDKFGNDPRAMMQAGVAYATDQIIDLYANGITNVHVYSMNKPAVAAKIQSNLSDMLGK